MIPANQPLGIAKDTYELATAREHPVAAH